MIAAFDIETIPNPAAAAFLPEPEAAKNLKDPAKIAADIAEKKQNQVSRMALDPLTGRICAYAMVSTGEAPGELSRFVEVLSGTPGDDDERAMVQAIMRALGSEDMRLATWNGANFDLPYVYKRALILGVDPAHFGAPPLSAWTKRYSTDRHFDLMQIWSNWGSHEYTKLDLVAGMVLGERKAEVDVTTFPEMLKTEAGCEAIASYCVKDTELTWRLFERMSGFLFV
jgi:DNA polymerase elongation subunit (family B)